MNGLTNRGDHPPSYIYRLIKEAYDDEDVEL
jgi:translation initiation factor eIF-2B subunit beta